MKRLVTAQMQADTAQQRAERKRYFAAVDTARREMRLRFDPITKENAVEATEWEARRIRELCEVSK